MDNPVPDSKYNPPDLDKYQNISNLENRYLSKLYEDNLEEYTNNY